MTEPMIVTVDKIMVWNEEFGIHAPAPDYDFTNVSRWESLSEFDTETTMTIRVYYRE